MRFKHPLPSRLPGVRVGARVVRDIGLDAGPRLAVQAARASVARMRRAMDRAVAQSPQSLFLRELMAQPGSVGAICASSPRLAMRMAEQVDPSTRGLVVELGGGTGVISSALLARGVAPERLVIIEQSEALAKFISYLGTTISVIFSIGAIIGAMITMYASVASRTAEVGTLRALGFPRGAILVAFLVEALLLGFLGGIVGLLAASAMQAVSISTVNFQTFAELAFRFTLTPAIVVGSLLFALLMGFIGGFLPAARAARMKIVDALRAA